MSKSSTERPGKLKGQTFLTLHTAAGQQIYYGRKQAKDVQHITGFNQFGTRLTQAYLRAAQDDLFYDYLLIKIEERILTANVTLKEIRKMLQTLIKSEKQLEIGVPDSVKPVKIPLSFRNPYAFRAADLLIVYDNICKLLNVARHTGRIDNKQFYTLVDRASKQMRSLMEMPMHYPAQGTLMTRPELASNPSKYQTLALKYGEVPEDVISKERRGAYAPRIYEDSPLRLASRPTLSRAPAAALGRYEN